MPNRVAYLVSRFPKISETFILREMITLQNMGWEILLYPLILEKQGVMHSEAEPWLNSLHYYPWLSLDVIAANARAFWEKPARYLSLFGRIVFGNFKDLSFLARAIAIFPKAICIANDMTANDVRHIHAHFATHPALAAWIIKQWAGITYSITAHAHDIYVNRTMLIPKVQDASLVVTISDFNRDFLTHHVGEQVREKINIVHCGIDPDTYSASIEKKNKGRFQVCSIGSLQTYKGMRYLLEACALLRNRGVPLHCQIVGDGEERKALEKMLVQHDLRDVATLLGTQTQSEVAQILQHTNCYVQPSVITETGKMEGIPVAIMEALSCALPVIASNISGIPELVRHKETGYLVPPAHPTMLADAIENVYKNPQEAARVGLEGRKLVLQEYSLDRNVAHLAHLLSEYV